eukprot:5273126-Pleurochrysis_carterae.AAC.1
MCHPRDIVTATIRLAHNALHARIELRLLDETEKRIDEGGATKIATSVQHGGDYGQEVSNPIKGIALKALAICPTAR